MARWDRGSGPTIPEWFFEAIETEHTTHSVEVDECDVVYQRWGSGEAEKPEVLLIHGMFAHSHWWDFIAPHLMDTYRIAAMDLTGMGDSDFRYAYDAETFSVPDCLTVIGWYKEALRMCGASKVTIEEVAYRARGDEFCRYEFSWT